MFKNNSLYALNSENNGIEENKHNECEKGIDDNENVIEASGYELKNNIKTLYSHTLNIDYNQDSSQSNNDFVFGNINSNTYHHSKWNSSEEEFNKFEKGKTLNEADFLVLKI